MNTDWKLVRKSKNKLVVESDGKEAASMDLSFDDQTVYLDYAFVDPSFRGSGVGNFLVKETLALLTPEYKNIIPVCGYVKAVFKKNRWGP
jgi:predicted GNAT family acetyltransferase